MFEPPLPLIGFSANPFVLR